MIISRIYGGFGNQLFQFAAAKALAAFHRAPVKLDTTEFDHYLLRNFDLQNLADPPLVASPHEIMELKATGRFQRGLQKLLPYHFKTFYKEPFFHFDPNFFRLGNDVYLQGYFQSEKYFTSISQEIRKTFDLTHLTSDPVKKTAALLQKEDSVSIHIRRGDYTNNLTKEVHGTLDLSYYKKAIQFFKTNIPSPKFYIFSDDTISAAQGLQSKEVNVLSGEVSSNHFEDLFLMSQCRHNIIANSSFSWWGAWLNNNPDKIVVAPKNWFNQGPKDTQDLIPESWTVL